MSNPGKWDQSAGGHVDEGEKYEDAAQREVREELGAPELKLQKVLKMFTEDTDELMKIKRRFSVLYVASYDGEIKPNHEEVSEVKWIRLKELESWMEKTPGDFTQGFVTFFKEFRMIQE